MTQRFYRFVLTFILTLFTCALQAQTYSKIKTYPIYYYLTQLNVLLWNCPIQKTYFVQVTNNNQIQMSPMDCSKDTVGKTVTEAVFDSNVQSLITVSLDLKLDSDKTIYDQKLATIFASPNFKAQLHTIYLDIIDSVSRPSDVKKMSDPNLLDNITILTAANFDFTNKVSASYLGLFNIFAPSALGSEGGVIAGIERISYSTASLNNNDSSVTYFSTRNLINPLLRFTYTMGPHKGMDSIPPGTSYHKQFYQYTYSNENVVWSFYVEPTILIHKFSYQDPQTGVFVHTHFEFLVNEWTRTTNFTTLNDTILKVNAADPPLTNNVYVPVAKTLNSNFNFMSGYFGAGFTLFLRPFPTDSLTHLLFQPTFGIAIYSPNFDELYSSTAVPAPNGQLPITPYNTKAKAFYLMRASFLRDLTSNSQLVVGFTIRGLLPTKYPQYAAYIGLNIGLTALTNLFSSGK